MYVRFLLIFVLLCANKFILKAQRPEQDCVGSVKICDNINFTVPVTYSGNGSIIDIPDNSTCLVNEENNSVWFYFDVDSAGEVVFAIEPIINEDYDFAVYKTNDCSEITDATVLPIRCNYAAQLGATGLAFGSTITNAGVADSLFLAPLPVLQGDRYYLMIDNFNSGQGGYNLNFSGTTAKFVTDTSCKNLEELFMNFNNIAIQKAFKIYPNPSDKEVLIQTENYIDVETITLYNLEGKQVRAEYIFKENAVIMNVSQISRGMYYIQIKTSQGNIVLKKLAVH